MATGILGAVHQEIALLRQNMHIESTVTYGGVRFTKGTLCGKSVVIGISDVGKVNAALAAQILIDRFHVKRIIFTGTAGAIHPVLRIGDVILSTKTQQYDVNFSALGFPPGVIPFLKTSVFAANAGLLRAAEMGAKEIKHRKFRVLKGKILTGDQFVANARLGQVLRKTFHGVCVEAEGGAVGQVAYRNKVPYLVIRGISDKVGTTGPDKYNRFGKIAARHTQLIVLKTLKNLSSSCPGCLTPKGVAGDGYQVLRTVGRSTFIWRSFRDYRSVYHR